MPWGTEDLQITATCSLCGIVKPGVGRWWRADAAGALYKQRGFVHKALGMSLELPEKHQVGIRWHLKNAAQIMSLSVMEHRSQPVVNKTEGLCSVFSIQNH